MGPRIFRIAQLSHGFLAIMPKPSVGEWADEEFSAIAAEGIQQIASLLEPAEAEQLGLADEGRLCAEHGLRFADFPIPDRGLPSRLESFAAFTWELFCDIAEGISTVVHCRAGIGRAGLTAATILCHAGYDPDEAFTLVSEARGVPVPDTEAQTNWLIDNAESLTAWTNRIALSPEEQIAVASLGSAEIDAIDEALLRTAREKWLKVAMVILRAEEKAQHGGLAPPLPYLHQRVKLLVENGRLEVQGDLRRPRFSEIRLARDSE